MDQNEYKTPYIFSMDETDNLSRAFPNTTVQKYQFFGTQLSLCSNSHIYT